MNVLLLVDKLIKNNKVNTNIVNDKLIKNNKVNNNIVNDNVPEKINDINDINILIKKHQLEIENIVPEYLKANKSFKTKYLNEINPCKNFTINEYTKISDDSRDLKDLSTDIVNFQILSDSSLTSFMYTINYVHNLVLDSYIKSKNLNLRDIVFVFKGGYLLKIIKDKFTRLFPGLAAITIENKYNNYIKRSDLDYSIYIDPSLENYDDIYNDICLIEFRIQLLLKKMFMLRPSIFFNWYKFNKNHQKDILNQKYIKSANKLDCFTNPVNKFFNNTVSSIILEDSNKLHEYNTKTDRIIKKTKDKTVKQCDIKLSNDNNNPFYVTYNDTIEFKDDLNINTTKFNLVRTKLNFNFVLKDLSTQITSTKNIGGELIDVSIIHKNDSNIANFFNNIDENIQEAKFSKLENDWFIYGEPIKEYNQIIQSIKYTYYDLFRIIFEAYYYPWYDRKYEKRLYRLFFVSIINFYNKIHNINKNNILNKLLNIKNKINEIKILLFDKNHSLEDSLKYIKKNKTIYINNISEKLKILEQEFNIFEEIHLIKILNTTMIIIVKVLSNHDLINKDIYKNKINLENIKQNKILIDLNFLIEFLYSVLDNLDTIISINYQNNEYCKNKNLDIELLEQFDL